MFHSKLWMKKNFYSPHITYFFRCYNPAKNYQFAQAGAWYNDKPQHTISWDSGKKSGTSWHGQLIGVAEYDNNPQDSPIVIRIVTGGLRDLFLGFNRQIGMNSDVKDAGDEVTLIEAGNGNNYAQSFMKAAMREGDTYEIDDWRKSKQSLIVRVNKIDTSVSPGYADVSIIFGSEAPSSNPPTRLPSSAPSFSPTSTPSVPPTFTPSSSPSTATPSVSPSSTFPTASNATQIPTAAPTTLNNTSSVDNSPLTVAPTISPSPTANTTNSLPSVSASTQPSIRPTRQPSQSPIFSPTTSPSNRPQAKA